MEGKPVNLSLLFFQWWYREAIVKIAAYFRVMFAYIADLFSVKICLRSLFAVWRRDYRSTEGLSIQQKFNVMLENMASRFIGFMVKSFVLLVFLLFSLGCLLFVILFFIFWIAFPLIIITLFISGISYLFL